MAEDGRDALAKALTGRYDAIVAETRLPGIDGYQLCQLLRRDPATLHTPILFVTADARTSEQQVRRSIPLDRGPRFPQWSLICSRRISRRYKRVLPNIGPAKRATER